MSETQKHTLAIEADRALFEGQISGLVCLCYQNEKPPQGLCGLMDWHFHGVISNYLQKGAITGKLGECTYLPHNRNGIIYHLILLGAGQASSNGHRSTCSNDTMQVLHKNLISLKLPKLGISKSDFGNASQDYFSKHLKGVPLWIVQ